MGKKLTQEILNALTEVVLHDIDIKSIDGVTYALYKEDNNESDIENYKRIRELLDKEGFEKHEVFRVMRVSNGYIFDIDLKVVKKIMLVLLKASVDETTEEKKLINIIGDKPEKKITDDIRLLGKYILKAVENGKKEVEVALFSTNSSPNITFTAETEDGTKVLIKYRAFTLRVSDIELVNEECLMKNGYRIKGIEVGEILPMGNGVHTRLVVEKLNKNMLL